MAVSLRACIGIAAVAAGLKLLLFPTYRSTDFEVHRNWLAITHSLPVSQWYIDSTSQWTLDYPPFFAWFEYGLSHVARFFDPKMLEVTNLNYASIETVTFQRLSVVATDIVFITAALALARLVAKQRSSGAGIALFALLVLNAGLLLVDHIHFQYNGIVIGILLWSIYWLLTDSGWLAGCAYTVLLHMKHLYVYCAPLYLVHIMRWWCGGGLKGIGRFLWMGITVLAISAVSLGPFIQLGQLPQLLSRLFPFGRGLTHSYWAANAWALYSAADKVLAMAMPQLVKHHHEFADDVHMGLEAGGSHSSSMFVDPSSGIVGVARYRVLPQVPPKLSLALVGIALLPPTLAILRRPHPSRLPTALAYALLSGFWFGYHVHEKAILPALLPLTIPAVLHKSAAADWLVLAAAGQYGLLPLLYEAQEYPIKILLCLVYWILSAQCLSAVHTWRTSQSNGHKADIDALAIDPSETYTYGGSKHTYAEASPDNKSNNLESPLLHSPTFARWTVPHDQPGYQASVSNEGFQSHASVNSQPRASNDVPATLSAGYGMPAARPAMPPLFGNPAAQPGATAVTNSYQTNSAPPQASGGMYVHSKPRVSTGGLAPGTTVWGASRPCSLPGTAPSNPQAREQQQMFATSNQFHTAPTGTHASQQNSFQTTSIHTEAPNKPLGHTPSSSVTTLTPRPSVTPPQATPAYQAAPIRPEVQQAATYGSGVPNVPMTFSSQQAPAPSLQSRIPPLPPNQLHAPPAPWAPPGVAQMPSKPVWGSSAAAPAVGAVGAGVANSGPMAMFPPPPPPPPHPSPPMTPPLTTAYQRPGFGAPRDQHTGGYSNTDMFSSSTDSFAGLSAASEQKAARKPTTWSLSYLLGAGDLLHPVLALYILGFVPLEIFCSFLHDKLLHGRLPFLPLLLTSTYCALGVGYVWLRLLFGFMLGRGNCAAKA